MVTCLQIIEQRNVSAHVLEVHSQILIRNIVSRYVHKLGMAQALSVFKTVQVDFLLQILLKSVHQIALTTLTMKIQHVKQNVNMVMLMMF